MTDTQTTSLLILPDELLLIVAAILALGDKTWLTMLGATCRRLFTLTAPLFAWRGVRPLNIRALALSPSDLQWAVKQGCTQHDLATHAVAGGAESLRWINAQVEQGTLNVRWNIRAMLEAAVACGRDDSLQFLLEQLPRGCEKYLSEDLYVNLARAGRLKILQCLPPPPEDKWEYKITREAAAGGHIETLAWLRKEGYRWDRKCFRRAAEQGNHAMIRWLYEKSCPGWRHRHTASWVVARGHTEMLKWMLSQDPPCSSEPAVFCTAANHGQIEIIELLLEHNGIIARWPKTCATTAEERQLDGFKFIQTQGYLHSAAALPWPIMVHAAKRGNEKLLRFLDGLGILEIPSTSVVTAALNGQVSMLRFMIRKKHPLPFNGEWEAESAARTFSSALECAASVAQLDIIKEVYYRVVCPELCRRAFLAVIEGNPKSFVSQRYPDTFIPYSLPTVHASLEVIRWLLEFGCEWDERQCYRAAAKRGSPEIFRLLVSEGTAPPGAECARICTELEILKQIDEFVPARKWPLIIHPDNALDQVDADVAAWMYSKDAIGWMPDDPEPRLCKTPSLDNFIQAFAVGNCGLAQWMVETYKPSPEVMADVRIADGNVGLERWVRQRYPVTIDT